MGWWIWVIRSISASIRNEFARGNCHINGIESFQSYVNGGLQNSRAFPVIRFIYTSKNVSSDFIIERKISIIEHSLPLSENPL